jgi:hypothetical protein
MADVCKDNACEITPLSAFLSTNLNNKIETYDRLGDRVKRGLGYPLVSLEIHPDQMRENIQIAVEYFTKYAGFTKEFLIFDSNLYEEGKGLRLDLLYTLANTNLDTAAKKLDGGNPLGTGAEYYGDTPETVFIATSSISGSIFSSSTSLSSQLKDGIEDFQIVDKTLFDSITAFDPSLVSEFKENKRKTLTLEGETNDATKYQVMYDYDVMDYRKVVEVTDFEEGTTTGISTLFTLEQTLAQQTYFSYAMGNYGFDLVSWYTMKEWLDTREKVLSLRKDIKFNSRTQYMQLYPQPKNRYYGVVSCFVEKPIRDVIKEQWVYEYTTALTMITIGMVRGKFSGVSLIGGGSLNYELLNEGYQRKKDLEEKLLTGASPGFGDTDPIDFIVG